MTKISVEIHSTRHDLVLENEKRRSITVFDCKELHFCAFYPPIEASIIDVLSDVLDEVQNGLRCG